MPEWLHIIIRSFSILVGLFFILKILGKKQLSELSFFETIVGITVGDIAGALSMDLAVSYLHGVVALLIWALFPFMLDFFAVKSKKFRDFVEGKSTVFIQNGKILEKNLYKEKVSSDELLEMLREKNVFKVADVEFASFEPTGDLSVLLKKEHQPITLGDIDPNPPQEKEPQAIIMDGKILEESLSTTKLTKSWIQKEMDERSIQIKDVFLAQIDGNQKLHIDLFDDTKELPHPPESKRVYATLKKCQAELELIGLKMKNQDHQDFYQQQAIQLTKLIQNLEGHLNETTEKN
ncbi:uncharacterized membrane protein YcaP (DUF421 family) [Bacillus mesophilus]|uniref:DUF421 domain-containing protein n=1 Tax=Bacillus mesophilus TaxID=1808955 RepID=A0A6M0Q556_9BACI|nr:DUF421 domain-containing protein [Bacillus mesophilus]MBM7659704.1 uncharacterized membrane protein YcaP (DUF421 family) [Bacillus mesophilus]NEY70570.1 DUF421 domain-containing protein [Bacillus mesophilus]